MKRLLTITILTMLSFGVFAQQQVRVFAHRGGRAEFDENTMQAFNGAYKAGIRGFEVDIRMTKEGDLVLMHDSTMERTTNAKGAVETSKTKVVKNAKTLKGNRLVMFDDFIKWIGSKGDIEYVEFELKTDPALYSEDLVCKMCDEVYNKIMSVKPAGSTFVITSFDQRPLIYVKLKHSDADLMYITDEPLNDAAVAKVKELGIKRLAAKMFGTSRTAVDKAHLDGIKVTLWPSDNMNDVALGISLGADNVCTDIPVEAKKALKDGMKWVQVEF